MVGCNTTVASEVNTEGLKIQIVDQRWGADAEMTDCQPMFQARWRIHPYRLKARGCITPGEMLNVGQLIIQPANSVLCLKAGGIAERVRWLICQFDEQWLRRINLRSRDWNESNLQVYIDVRNENINHSMRRLALELTEPGLESSRLSASLGTAVAVDIARYFDIVDTKSQSENCVHSNSRVRQIRNYVTSFAEGSPTLADVAVACNMSVAHLRRLFKQATGQTLHDYIEEVRITRAQTLLAQTPALLKEVSYTLGYCHPSAFSFAFKRATGEAPRAYRERYELGAISP